MRTIIASIRRGWGKTASCLLAVFFAFAATQSAWADEVVDLNNETITYTDSASFGQYKGKELRNGTINLNTAQQGSAGWGEGSYTIGSGATVNCEKQAYFNGSWTFTLIDGGEFKMTTSDQIFYFPFRYGNVVMNLSNGGKFTSAAEVWIGGLWNNKNESKDKNNTTKFVMTDGSSIDISVDKELKIGVLSSTVKAKTIKNVIGVTNSTITAKQIRVGQTTSYITDKANSFNKITFGPGTVLNVGQVYSYAYPAPTVVFDGAKICWNADKGDSIIGQNNGVTTRIYTIGPNGLVIDKQSGFSRTGVSNMASALSGTGGITKTGPGDITWNTGRIGENTTEPMTFTGPLVISNGTWTSTLGYAASAFRADGATLTLSGALSAANVALAATEGGKLTLANATITDVSPDLTLAGGGTTDYFTRDGAVGAYTLDSLTLGPGAVLDLDADATAVDAINATTMSITATSANPATINLNFSAAPSTGATFTIFEVDSPDKFTVVPKLGNFTLPHEESVVDGRIVITIMADDYTWKGTQEYWGDENAWTMSGADATWSDGNNAIFASPNASVSLSANATASKVSFTADATIDGSATLAAAEVSVDSGVSATISVPTDGTMSKTGAGTLTLGAPRMTQTTLTEGTLVMASGATVDGTKLKLGTDAAKPVVFDYGAQTLTAAPAAYLGAGTDVTLANGTFADTAGGALHDANFPSNLTIMASARFTTGNRFTVNTGGEKTINVIGGEFCPAATGSEMNAWFMQNSSGRLRVNATGGAVIKMNGYLYAGTGHDSAGLSPKLEWVMVDSSMFIDGHGLFLGNRGNQNVMSNYPILPECRFSMTNSVFSAAQGFIIGQVLSENTKQRAGYYIAEFDDCIVTSKQCRVYGDRPASGIHFNGTTLVSNGAGDYWIAADGFEDGVTPVTVGAKGLVLDANGNSMQLSADLVGSGDVINKLGSGKLTVTKSQTGTGAMVCESGETFIGPGLTVNRPVLVKNGGKFTVKGTKQATISSLTLEAGSTLNIDTYTIGVTPLAVETLTLPSAGKATLTLNGTSFKTGRYAILSKSGIVESDFANLEISIDGVAAAYCVENGTLYVNAMEANDYIWTGAGDGEKFSDGNNWLGYMVPPNGANLLIGVAASASAALVCDIADFSPAAITFSVGSAAVTIDGDEAISGVAAITNLSSVSHTINVPVRFVGNIQVKQAAMAELGDLTKAHVTFAGGAYAAPGYAIENGNFTAVYSRCMYGKYYLANNVNSPWAAAVQGSGNRICLADNSTLYVPYAGRMTELYIGNGSKVDIGEMVSDGGRVSYRNCGEVVVTNLTLSGTGDRYATYNQTASTSVPPIFKFERIETAMTANWFYFSDGNGATKGVYYIGAGGLNFSSASAKGAYCIGRNSSNDAQTLRPWYSDFTIADRGNGEKSLVINRDVTFCTDDEGGVGRTITVDAIIQGNSSPTITVSGSGTLLINKAAANATQPPVTVTNTATLAIKPGVSLTTSTMTLNSGTTLQVAESGTFALGGDLVLKAGAQLGFNYTTSREPVLNLTDKTVTFDEGETTNVVVKISANAGRRAKSGTNVLTSGGKFTGATVSLADGAPDWALGVSVNENGDIVLDAKLIGSFFMIR